MYHLWPPLDYKPYVGRLSVSYTCQGEQLAECLEHGGQESTDSQTKYRIHREVQCFSQKTIIGGRGLTSVVKGFEEKKKSKRKKIEATQLFSSVQFSSVAQSCPTLCDPMNHSTPGLPVHHQLPEFTQTHVHWVTDAIQPSHPLSSPSPPAPNPSQHQGLFQWVNFSHQEAKGLEFQLQHQSFQWTPRTALLQDGLVGSPCNPEDSQESPPTPHFKSINSSALSFLSQSNSHIHT